MKTIKIAIFALLLIPFAGMAQVQPETAPTHQQDQDLAKVQTEWMQKNLNLTADQIEDVQEVNAKYAEKTQSILASTEEKAEKLSDLTEEREEYNEEIREILDDEQFAKFQMEEKNWFEKAKSKVGDTQE